MSDFIVAVISFLVVLGPLVIIHELGHFLAARAVGVTVLEFGLGFPPRAVKLFEQGGTIFSLNWLPIGGFVRPLGEDFVKPTAEGEVDVERAAFEKLNDEREARGKARIKAKSVMEATPWQRIFFLIAGGAMNILGAFLLLVVSGMVGQPSPAVVIYGLSPNTVAANSSLKSGDIISAVNGTAVQDATAVRTALEDSLAKPITLTIERDGQKSDITLNPPTDYKQNSKGVLVSDTTKGLPADGVLKSGDIILKVDGVVMTSINGLKEYIRAHADQPVNVTYVRDGAESSVSLTPKKQDGDVYIGVGIIQFDAFFGVGAVDTTNGAIVKLGLVDSLQFATSRIGSMVSQIASAPINIITGKLKGNDGRIVSPVGIAQMSSEVLTTSVQNNTPYLIINFIAVISVALAVTNLLPIPGLDGGRILFVIIELVRGKPMAPEREGLVHLIGLMLLLGLVAVLVVNDLINPIGKLLR